KAECRKQNWIDSAGALDVLIAHCERIPNLPKQIVAFAFDTFTPLQQDLWRALQRAGVTTTLLSPDADVTGESPRVVECCDSDGEIRSAALWARAKLEASPSARIGIIVPGLPASRNQIERIFTSVLHPEHALLGGAHGARCFEISLGHPLSEHPMVRTAFRLLRLATTSLSAEEWTALLLSRYWSAGTTEAAARARVDAKLRKRLRSSASLGQVLRIARGNPLNRESDLRTLAPKLFKTLSDLEHEAGKLPRRMTRSQWATELRRLLPLTGWPGDAGGELTLNSEEFQVSRAWDSLLAQFGALDQVLAEASLPELQRELEQAAREVDFALENHSAPIQIVGPRAASGECFEALWFCGLSDDMWPQRTRPNAFLPHSMQIAARLPNSSTECNLEAARRVTARLLQSADDCVLSWPKKNDERDLQPSPLLVPYAGIGA